MYGIYNSMIYGSLVKCFYTQYTIKKNVEQQINKYYQSCRNWYTYIDALLSSSLNPLEGPSVLNYGFMELGGAPDF